MKKKHKRALSAALQCIVDLRVQLDELAKRLAKLEKA